MTHRILFLGHNIEDAAVKRRISGLREQGHDVLAYAYSRSDASVPGLRSLGHVADGQLKARLLGMCRAIWVVLADKDFRGVDAIYARNMDLGLVGLALRVVAARRAQFHYEVLDIHPMLVGDSFKAKVARWIERRILNSCQGLVTSSPCFLDRYFRAIQGFHGTSFLMENKVEAPVDLKEADNRTSDTEGPLVLVYAGKLRCQKSLRILHDVASRAGPKLQIRLAGTPLPELQEDYDRLTRLANTEALGPYDYPQDLVRIYKGAHLNWTIDYQAAFNSSTLLPNRLYEGGLFGIVPLTRKGTATADRAADWGIGIDLSEPLESNLIDFINDPWQRLEELHNALHKLPTGCFAITDDYARLSQFITGMDE